MLLFTLDPGVGEAGFTAPLTMPLSVGIWEEELVGVPPSAERMSRVAGGKAFGFGFFCLLLLKRKDMVGGSGDCGATAGTVAVAEEPGSRID